MSKWIEVRRKSVLPWYFAGLVWLVGALALPIYQLWALVVVAVLSVVGFAGRGLVTVAACACVTVFVVERLLALL